MKKVLTMALTFATVASLVISASASNFVSSVVQTEAPPVEDITMTDADGNTVENTFEIGDIIVTPVSESHTLEDIDADARAALEAAYEEIDAADDLAEYFDLPELTNEDEYYVVSALFDVTFTGTAVEAVESVLAAGGSVTITFQAQISNPDSVSVYVQCDGENWTAGEVNSATTSSVTATFTQFCPVAIVEVASTTTSDTGTSGSGSGSSDDSVTSPKTSDGVPAYAIGAVTFVVLAAACFVAGKKRA
ncbi:MAG: hypothetical protein LUF28_08725 [Clostridiales bacterium]|nr:hypothetical protein [Clostridiales bacterium]